MHDVLKMLVLTLCAPSTHASGAFGGAGLHAVEPPRCARLEADGGDVRFASGGEARFPYEEVAGHLFVRGEIDGSTPLWFTLDTGASLSLLDAGRARALGLRVGPGRAIEGAGGTEVGGSTAGVTLGLPGVEIRLPRLDVLPLDFLREALGRDVDLILGYEFWSRLVVEVDPVAREIRVRDPETWTYRGAGEALPIRLQQNCPYVTVQLRLPGTEAADVECLEGECIVDTGSGNTLIFQRAFVEAHGLRDRIGNTLSLRAGGVGGEMEMSLARLPSLRVGRFEIEHALVLLPEGGEFAAPGSAGNLGCGFLRRFRTTFDYRGGRMILEPNARFAESDEADMCGAALAADPDRGNAIRVAKVRAGSPADEAGVRAGDEVVAIDGRAAAEVGLEGLRALLREHGRERVLGLRRGGEALEVRVKLRRMI